MDIKDLLRAMHDDDDHGEKAFKSQKEAREYLTKFNSQEMDFKEGDFIERNQYGVNRYRVPSKNQAMQVIRILPPEKYIRSNKDDSLENVIVSVAMAEGRVVTLAVDGRFFQKAGAETNVTSFKNYFKKK